MPGQLDGLAGKSGEFAVALRSAVIGGGEATLFAGCGIVADSEPDLEYKESILKLRPMQAAITAAIAKGSYEPNESDAITEVSR
jgi:Isochorismate synthase